MSKFNYFTDAEVVGLDNELCAMLDKARHRSMVPYVITSGLRTTQTNTDPNAAKDSAHLTGHAVDLDCNDSRALWRMIDGLMFAGFKRIGIYFKVGPDGKGAVPTHVHVDNDISKPQEVCWLTREL